MVKKAAVIETFEESDASETSETEHEAKQVKPVKEKKELSEIAKTTRAANINKARGIRLSKLNSKKKIEKERLESEVLKSLKDKINNTPATPPPSDAESDSDSDSDSEEESEEEVIVYKPTKAKTRKRKKPINSTILQDGLIQQLKEMQAELNLLKVKDEPKPIPKRVSQKDKLIEQASFKILNF
jgi:hypothetical protein